MLTQFQGELSADMCSTSVLEGNTVSGEEVGHLESPLEGGTARAWSLVDLFGQEEKEAMKLSEAKTGRGSECDRCWALACLK